MAWQVSIQTPILDLSSTKSIILLNTRTIHYSTFYHFKPLISFQRKKFINLSNFTFWLKKKLTNRLKLWFSRTYLGNFSEKFINPPDLVEITTDSVPLARHVLQHNLYTRGGSESLELNDNISFQESLIENLSKLEFGILLV